MEGVRGGRKVGPLDAEILRIDEASIAGRLGVGDRGLLQQGTFKPRLSTPSATLVEYRFTLGFSCIIREIRAS